jgi:tight adherence protein B
MTLILAIKNKRSTDMFYRMRRHTIIKGTRKPGEVEDLKTRFLRFIKEVSKPLVEKNFAQSIEERLNQAGIPLLGGEFIVLNLLTMALTGFLTWFITLDIVFAGGVTALVPVAFWVVLIVLKSRRLKSFTEQLGDCLITISNALRAGYSFQQTIEVISKEMEPPIGSEFAMINHEIVMGVPLEEALENANKRIGSSDFELVVTAVLIQREVGGNLAQVLDNISYTIVERIRMRREIVALTSQGRMSAFVLLALPFVAGFVMFSLNPKNFMIIFEEPMGQIAVIVGIVMEIIGYFVIMKIVDVDV